MNGLGVFCFFFTHSIAVDGDFYFNTKQKTPRELGITFTRKTIMIIIMTS